jgi:hypothetical protein
MNEALGGSLWTFALTALVIEITHGPNMGYLAVLSLSRGWQASAAAVIGVALDIAVRPVCREAPQHPQPADDAWQLVCLSHRLGIGGHHGGCPRPA